MMENKILFLILFLFLLIISLIPSVQIESNKNDNMNYPVVYYSLGDIPYNPFEIQKHNSNHNSTYIEKIGDVFHIWNDYNNYYINESGLQLTNHYQEFWAKNVWCLWVDGNMRCSDGMNWNWVNDTDGYSWVELNGTATYSEGSYSAVFRVRYYLNDSMDRIKVSIGLKNTGKYIDDLYFGWATRNIMIDGVYEYDFC